MLKLARGCLPLHVQKYGTMLIFCHIFQWAKYLLRWSESPPLRICFAVFYSGRSLESMCSFVHGIWIPSVDTLCIKNFLLFAFVGYTVLYTTDPSLADDEWHSTAVASNAQSVRITDLEPNSKYYFRVRTQTSQGLQTLSPTATFETGSYFFFYFRISWNEFISCLLIDAILWIPGFLTKIENVG